MSKCLIVLDHSFRLNSLMIKFAFSTYKEISIVYVSNWYYDSNAKKLYTEFGSSFFKETINYFAYKLEKKYGQSLYILKTKNPEKEIENFCIENKVDTVLYDKPLFSKKINFSKNVNVLEIDNDSYIPECEKMTAKSRWTFWDRNRLSKDKVFIKEKDFSFYKPLGEKYYVNFEMAQNFGLILKNHLSSLKSIVENYSNTRNSRNGSTKISKYLHHGVIDSRELTHIILSQTSLGLTKENKYVPILRQLAFREICINKIRSKNISLFEETKSICNKVLDKESINNLTNNLFDPVFTKEQLFNGNTGLERLDREINLCIKNRWMPNRARMWFAGECYWGLGGGFKSLDVLIEFFNRYSEDAQSPNNIISCVESMRLKYGKVMRFNEQRTFKLLNDEVSL